MLGDNDRGDKLTAKGDVQRAVRERGLVGSRQDKRKNRLEFAYAHAGSSLLIGSP